MKEVDEIVIEEEVIDNIEYDKLSDKAKVAAIKSAYNNCKTIKDRYEFLIELRVMGTASLETDSPIGESISAVMGELEGNFIDEYIMNGTNEQRQQVIETCASYKEYYDTEMYHEMERHAFKFEANEEDIRNKSAWLAKSGKFEMYVNYNNNLTSTILENYSGKKVRNDVAHNTKIKSETTMQEYAIMCGFRGEDIEKYLGSCNAQPNTSISNHFTKVLRDNPNIKTERDVSNYIIDNMIEKQKSNWAKYSKENYYNDNSITPMDRSRIEELADQTKSDIENDSVKKWRTEKGNDILDASRTKYVPTIMKDFKNKYVSFKKAEVKKTEVNPDRVRDLKASYATLKTPEEKLDFLYGLNATAIAKGTLAGKTEKTDNKILSDLIGEFIDEYVKKGDYNTISRVMTYLGKIKCDANLKLVEAEQQCKNVIDNEDPYFDKKVKYLARYKEAGVYLISNNSIQSSILFNINTDQNVLKEVEKHANVKENTTMKDIIALLGYDEKASERLYSDFKASPDTLAFDAFREKMVRDEGDDNPDPDYVNQKINQFIRDCLCSKFYDKGASIAMKEANFPADRIEEYNNVSKDSGIDASPHGIEDWIKEEGNALMDQFAKDYVNVVDEFETRYNKGVSFDHYIVLHTGKKAIELPDIKKEDCLAEALAAKVLMDAKEKYDVKKIKAAAENIKQLSEFDRIIADKDKVDDAFRSRASLDAMAHKLTQSAYKVSSANVTDYVNEMKKLYESLMPEKNRTAEYKAFYGAVKKIADLTDKYDFDHDYDRKVVSKELVDLNANLMLSVKNYVKGKKSVRWTDGGKERFNNNLDALGTLLKYAPDSKQQIDKLVNRINDVRWERNRVDLKDYNADRAVNKKAAREKKGAHKAL